ncbi:MAG: NUDIX domain-containing protein [Lachnospiraceae bacterium]|nr:NUDIX domain-containing protein [Lachnospiraceae bacterium]
MSRTEEVTLTNMCMIYDGSKVLVQEKIDDDYGRITFPGGHVEKNELFTDAVIREVYWLELEEMKQIHLAEGMDKMLEVFLDDNISEYFFYKDNGKLMGMLK